MRLTCFQFSRIGGRSRDGSTRRSAITRATTQAPITFNGLMDELAMWNVALTPAQIRSHYLAGGEGYGLDGGVNGLELRRGDPDDSGGGNITDAIAVLNHLFAGAPRPACWAAADANGDGGVNVSDPVYQLNFLFGGGTPPPPPGPDDCGLATESDHTLGCEQYTSC